MTIKPPLSLRARSDEPAHAVLIRLGLRNGYQSARRFAASLEMDFRKLFSGPDAFSIAALAGLDPETVRRCSPTIVLPDRKIDLCGHRLELTDWGARYRRYCSACYAFDVEEAHRLRIPSDHYVAHRTFWDVRLIAACPIHRISLESCCHCCGRKLDWQLTDLRRCAHCQTDLLAAPPRVLSDPAGEYVAARLKGDASANEVLDHLPLSNAMRLCERLGLIGALGPLRTLPRQSDEVLFRARSEGFRMVQDLESRLPQALDKLVGPSAESNGLVATYGWVYGEWLACSDGANDRVRPILLKHAIKNGVISKKESRLGNDPPDTLTMTQAARQMHMGYKRARALASEAGIVPRGSRRSVAFTLEPSDVALLQRTTQSPSHLRVVAQRLQTGPSQVRDLVAAGLLHRAVGGSIAPASVEQLLQSLHSRCHILSPPADMVPLGVAARNAAVPMWRIVQAAHVGSLACWKVGDGGLSAFGVRMQDVSALRAKPRKLSVEAAARQIGVHHECARAMARCGTIADVNGLITDEGIAHFEREFAVGSKLAAELGRSPRAVHRLMLSAGVRPAFDLATHRQAVYRREDVARSGLLS